MALASGSLTGTYRPGTAVESVRAGLASQYLNDPENVALPGTVDVIAASHGVSATAVALAWLRQQAGAGAPIDSARTAGPLDALIESFSLTLTLAELNQLK
jgi:aryl-alcohol dehydrogenase-like predicted oxidoreductase